MKNNIIFVNVSSNKALNIDMVLERGKREILDWFNKQGEDPKINIYIYEDSLKLKEGIRKRTNKNILSNIVSYTILENEEKGITRSINIVQQGKEYKAKEYNEILFRELAIYIINYLYGELPNWVINGLINNLDSNYKSINTDYLILRIKSSVVPNIDNISLNPKYNEYTYLIIKYILDEYGKDYLLDVLMQEEHFNLHGQDYLNKALLYFNQE